MGNQLLVVEPPKTYKMDKKEEVTSYEEAINQAAGLIYRFPLIEVQGVPLMNWIVQNWSAVQDFCPDPSDLLISTYPKAGNNRQVLKLVLRHDSGIKNGFYSKCNTHNL